MPAYIPRAGRAPLALTLVVSGALAALGACADRPAPIEPSSRPARQLVAGDVVTVTSATGDASVVGSLPWAVSVAPSGATIRFAAGLAGATIVVGELHLINPLTIEGPADRGITISGGSPRVFRTQAALTLRNVTVSGGAAGFGSAILASGALLLEHSTVTGSSGVDGAIFGDDVTLVNSTVSDNVGGGIAYPYTGKLTLVNSTIAHNGPTGIGPLGTSGSIPTVIVRNSIIANNGQSQNCGDLTGVRFEGMNVTDGPSCGTSLALHVGDPLLGALADNGGPTRTVSFGNRSPALNAANGCGLTVDQRYVARDALCDVGAFEFTDFTVVTITIDATQGVGPNGAAVVAGTVKCSRNDDFGLVVGLQQEQKPGRSIVQGTGGVAVACTTTAQRWSATVSPASGSFVKGSGVASARTNDTPIWVTPSAVSSAVRLAASR
jgi:hypothetical protein